MQAGQFRTKVVFQEEVKTPDSGGGHSLSWGGGNIVFCRFVSKSGREALATGQVVSVVNARLEARAQSVAFLDNSWRCLINSEIWNVKAVIPFGQNCNRVDITIERGGSV